MKKLSITAVIEKDPSGWYVGQLEEFPEVISQGKTIEDLKLNLMDALSLVMEEQREKTQEQYWGKTTIRRKITFA
jgi:predicted RNase H-like HicB family nuclease